MTTTSFILSWDGNSVELDLSVNEVEILTSSNGNIFGVTLPFVGNPRASPYKGTVTRNFDGSLWSV